MKLLTEKIIKRFAEVGLQDEDPDPLIIAKFFGGPGTWYAISYDPEWNTCFGYVTGLDYDELGSFSIDELESVRIPPFGLPIERDLYFIECRLSDIKLGKVY